MRRRDFLALGTAVGAIAAATGLDNKITSAAQPSSTGKRRFKLKYAPHFGMFASHAGPDLLDQLRFMADQGFTALEDNGLPRREVEMQEKIGKELQRLNMEMGVFVAHGSFQEATFASGNKDLREKVLADVRNAVEIGKRVNARWCTIAPGTIDPRQEPDYQMAHAVETLKYCAEICEPAGLTMVLEPLNPWRDHPGMFLTKIPQAYLICKAVNSPSCKILFDIYHQQITEGNLIPNMEKAWSEIAYFQIGDNPGRKEPTTGEINYKNIFKFLHGREFQGIMGMEHGNSKPGKEGEQALIDAYVSVDDF